MPTLQDERVLVTGSAGFIDSHLVDLRRGARDADVIVLDNPEPQAHPGGPPPWLRPEATFRGDIRSVDDPARARKGVRYAFHAAGYGGFVPDVR